MNDPMRKEVAIVRKRIDLLDRELKPLGLSCQKKVKYHNLFSKLRFTISSTTICQENVPTYLNLI